jgi:hypothetical protein
MIKNCEMNGGLMGDEMKLGVYQHYRGKYYYLLMIARHAETAEKMAVYIPLYCHHGGGLVPQVRPLAMFCGDVIFTDPTEIKMYGREVVKRFLFVGVELPSAPTE